MRWRPLTLVLALLATLLIACGDDNDPSDHNASDHNASDHTASDHTASDQTTSSSSDGDGDGPEPDGSVTDLDGATVTLVPMAEVEMPIAMVTRNGSPDLFVGERAGRVRTLVLDDEGHGQLGPIVVDISDETTTDAERGLLGLAFHPDSTRLYVSFTDSDGDTNVDEWSLNGIKAIPESRRTVYSQEQPFPNHNGGHIAFGPDGLLYLALGDGGGGGDPLDAGQDMDTALGKIIRIDPTPDGAAPYTIPADNPFADGGGLPEIFISGVRNPWRFSWDSDNGDLWIADVGQESIEEINWLPGDEGVAGLGANLGWSIFEGDQRFSDGAEPPGYVAPIHTYSHGPGCSVTGGVVVRDPRLSSLFGAYLFSDFCDPTIYGLLQRDGTVVDTRSLGVQVPEADVVSFGVGPNREVYVLSLAGRIYRIDPA